MLWVHDLQCSFSFSHQTRPALSGPALAAWWMTAAYFFVVGVFLNAAASFPYLPSKAQGHGSPAAEVHAEPLSHHGVGGLDPVPYGIDPGLCSAGVEKHKLGVVQQG